MRDAITYPLLQSINAEYIFKSKILCQDIVLCLNFKDMHTLSRCNKYLHNIFSEWTYVLKKRIPRYLKDIYLSNECTLMQETFSKTNLMRILSSSQHFFYRINSTKKL